MVINMQTLQKYVNTIGIGDRVNEIIVTDYAEGITLVTVKATGTKYIVMDKKSWEELQEFVAKDMDGLSDDVENLRWYGIPIRIMRNVYED
jgi:hypothetical protein